MGEPFRGTVFQEKRRLITSLASSVFSAVHERTGKRFYKKEIRGNTLKIKSNKTTGSDGLPAETWESLHHEKGKGNFNEILFFIKIKNGNEYPSNWKTVIIYPLYKRKSK
jgi:hypothetical protein